MEDNAKTIITVAGDYVQSKHVDYEIGKVETGGIGIQIINGQPQESNPTPQRKPRATKQGTKYTQATFEYKYFKQHSNRLALLFQRLQTNAKWIAEDTTPENFTTIFEGKSCDSKVKWIDSKARLYYLIRQLVERGLIKVPNGTTIWQITESHFIDKNSRHFHDLHKQKAPKRSTLAIDKLIDILDPSIKDEN